MNGNFSLAKYAPMGSGRNTAPLPLKRIIIAGGSALALLCILVLVLYGLVTALFSKNPGVSWNYIIQRESHFLRRDTYSIAFIMYHEADESLKGNILFVVHGPCKLHQFSPGDIRSNEALQNMEQVATDTYLIRVADWKPGRDHLRTLVFDLDSPELNQKGLSDEEIKARISLKATGGFYPRSGSGYQDSVSSRVIGKR